MKTTKLLICAISVVAAFAAARASAQTFTTTLVDINPGLAVNGTLDNGAFVQDYPSGVMQFDTFKAFCVEPTQGLSYGESLIYEVQDIGLLANSDKIARLIGGYLASSQSDADAAAVHWAIWETTTESLLSPSLLDGSVRISPISSSTATLANQYLTNINTFTPVQLFFLSNPDRQNVVAWPQANFLPEPGTLTLASFSAFLLLRRRR